MVKHQALNDVSGELLAVKLVASAAPPPALDTPADQAGPAEPGAAAAAEGMRLCLAARHPNLVRRGFFI